MGEPDKQLVEISSLIQQIKDEITMRGKYFELGDDPAPLDSVEGIFNKICEVLESTNGYYLSKPLHESNPYFSAVRVAHQAQEDLKGIHLKGEGSKENTSHVLALLDNLDKSVAQLINKKASDISVVHNSGDKNFQTGPVLSVAPDHQTFKLVQSANPPSVPTRSSIRQPPTPIKPTETQAKKTSWLLKALTAIFVSLPHVIGRAILDIFGRGKDSADSSAILLGYVLIILAALALWGIIDINSLRDWFTGWWRFFNPVK